MNISTIIKSTKSFLGKHSPEIFTGLGIAGMITTAVLAVKATPKAVELIEEYPSMQVDNYTDRSNALEEEHFKQKIRQGTCRDSVRIVKTFRLRIAETRARNKKPPVAYERILKQASQRSLEELSVALEMPVDDVKTLFEKKLDENQN